MKNFQFFIKCGTAPNEKIINTDDDEQLLKTVPLELFFCAAAAILSA